MKKTISIIAILIAITTLLTNCQKAKNDGSNLKVTFTIPSSGFDYQGKLQVFLFNYSNGTTTRDSVNNGGSVSYKLINGNYLVHCEVSSNHANYGAVTDGYHTTGGSNGQDVQISSSDLIEINFTKWCQYQVSSNYCN